MYDHNQLDVPDSFVALFSHRGRLEPGATREAVSRRYELCEDLAHRLVDYAHAQHHDAGFGQAEVLARCRRGLADAGSGFEPAEAEWVIRRLAELEGWPFVEPEAGPSSPVTP